MGAYTGRSPGPATGCVCFTWIVSDASQWGFYPSQILFVFLLHVNVFNVFIDHFGKKYLLIIFFQNFFSVPSILNVFTHFLLPSTAGVPIPWCTGKLSYDLTHTDTHTRTHRGRAKISGTFGSLYLRNDQLNKILTLWTEPVNSKKLWCCTLSGSYFYKSDLGPQNPLLPSV